MYALSHKDYGIIYIGKAKSIRDRLRSHLNATRGRERAEAFVASDHSWYKEGFKRTTPFVFYLDPNAGRKIKKVKLNPFRKAYRFIPLPEDKEARYYRSAHGFWNYHTAEYTVNYLPAADGLVRDSRPFIGLNIMDDSVQLHPIP